MVFYRGAAASITASATKPTAICAPTAPATTPSIPQTASEDADWLVRECSGNVGGYEMESRTAKYNGKYSQWLEYYSDSFKVYSMYSSTGDLDYTIYSFSLLPRCGGTG